MVVYRYHLVPAPQAPVLDGREAWFEGADDDGTVLGCRQRVQTDTTLPSAHAAAVNLHDVLPSTGCDSPVDGLVGREDILEIRAQYGNGLRVGASLGRVFRGPAKI